MNKHTEKEPMVPEVPEVENEEKAVADDVERRLADYEAFESNLARMLDADPRARKIFETLAMGGEDATKLIDEYERLEKEYEKNIEESLKGMEEFLKAHEVSEQETDAVLTSILETVHEGIMGNITPAMLLMALKAHRYDEAVAAATQKGHLEGRNESIREHLRSLSGGDMPNIARGAAPKAQKRASIFTEALRAK